MAEAMIGGRVDLDKSLVWAFDIGVKKPAWRRVSADDVADVRQGREELRASRNVLFVGRLHVLGAPAEMPDGRSQFPGRRLVDFIKQQPGFLRPDGVEHSGELRLLAIELRCVEIDRAFRVESVQVQVMKMSFGKLSLGGLVF